jgi:hypothetical protein
VSFLFSGIDLLTFSASFHAEDDLEAAGDPDAIEPAPSSDPA